MQKKLNQRIVVLCLILLSIFLNIAFNFLVSSVLMIPLFLDTIGTVFITFAVGWIPGTICAVLTTLLDSLIGGYFLQLPTLYVFCSIMAVGITQFFKFYIFNTNSVGIRIAYLFIMSIIMCLLISIMGGIIDSFCITFSSYNSNAPVASDYFKPSFFQLGFSQLGTNIISRFPVNIIDRPITVFLAYGAVLAGRKLMKKTDTE